MRKGKYSKLIREGKYVAKVEVEFIESNDDWSHYLSLEDVYKLDDVREALCQGNIKAITQHGKVYSLTPAAM